MLKSSTFVDQWSLEEPHTLLLTTMKRNFSAWLVLLLQRKVEMTELIGAKWLTKSRLLHIIFSNKQAKSTPTIRNLSRLKPRMVSSMNTQEEQATKSRSSRTMVVINNNVHGTQNLISWTTRTPCLRQWWHGKRHSLPVTMKTTILLSGKTTSPFTGTSRIRITKEEECSQVSISMTHWCPPSVEPWLSLLEPPLPQF